MLPYCSLVAGSQTERPDVVHTMKKRLQKAIDDIVALLQCCTGNEDWIGRFVVCRRRINRRLHDPNALEELRILCAPRGFLCDSPHYPKETCPLTSRQVYRRAEELGEEMYRILKEIHAIQAKSDAKILHAYPIAGKVSGWFFRLEERSASCWIAKGTDRFGRHVHREGYDADQLLRQCIADAQNIVSQVRTR